MVRILINDAARRALMAEGAHGNLESAGDGLYWLDIDADIWQALLRDMAGEWDLTETSDDEATCVSNAIVRRCNKQIGNA